MVLHICFIQFASAPCDLGTTLSAGQMPCGGPQNGAAHYAAADNFAQNDDNASAATERLTEDEYADSATHSHGSHGMLSKPERTHKAHDHFGAQDSYEDDHTETSSEGTR